MADDLGTGAADYVAGGFLVAGGVDEVTYQEARDAAAGEESVEIGVGVTRRLLGLVFGVGYGEDRAPRDQPMSGRRETRAASSSQVR